MGAVAAREKNNAYCEVQAGCQTNVRGLDVRARLPRIQSQCTPLPGAAVCFGISGLLVFFCRQPLRDAAWVSDFLSK